MSDPASSEEVLPRSRARRPRRGPPAWVRRGILAIVVAGLVGANAWVVRNQFFMQDRRRNAAYDAGLRLLDIDHDFAQAELEFRRYLEIDPRSDRVRYLVGVALQYQGKFDAARAEYRRIIAQNPDFDDAHVAMAEIDQGEQAYEEAFQELDLAAAHDPTPTAVYVLRARMLAATGDQDGAVAAYRETLRRDPDSYESAIELGDLLMARSVLGGSVADRQAAAAVYRDAEEVCGRRLSNVEDKRLRLLLAKAIAGQSRVLQQRQLGDAVAELRKAAALDPEDSEPALVLGGFFRSAGNFEEAGRILEDARRKWKQPKVFVALFELYRDQRRNDDALKVLQDAVGEWVGDASLRVRLVAYLASIDRCDDAEREAAAAEQLFGSDDQVHAARGDLAREQAVRAQRGGDADSAVRLRGTALAAYRRALTLRPKSLRLKKLVAGELIEAMVRKAPGAEMSPDEKLARGCIDDVLRVNPRDAEALGWRARLLLVDGSFDEVVALLRPVLATSAPPVDALRILGIAAARSAERELAASAFARVVELQRDPDHESGPSAPGHGPPPQDWWNAIHSALEAGKQDVAIEMGVVAVRLVPGSADLRRELGAAYLVRGEGAQALRVLQSARADFPKDLGTRLLLARALEAGGDVAAAENELKTSLLDMPSETARMAYFEFLVRTGRSGAAEQGFLELVASEPDSPAGYLRLGDFYLSLKPPRNDAALDQYSKALDLTHGGAAPLLRIAEMQLGLANRDASAYAAAEAAVAAYAKAAPGDPWTDYLGGKLALAGGRPAEALPMFERFTGRVPTSPAGLYYHARALRDCGRGDEALVVLERAAKLDPDDPATSLELGMLRHGAGVKAFQKGDYATAQRLFAAAESGGASRGSRLLLAGAQANAGDLALSETQCRKLLADEPRNGACIHLLAQLLLRKGSKDALDETEKLYRRALDLDPADLLARIGIGTVRFERGDFRGALETLREVYPRTDGAPAVAMVIAQCMALVNDSAGAATFLDAEIQAHPKSDAMHHMKGDFLVHMKQPLDALPEFEKAYALNPDNVIALLAAAAALMDAREYERARKFLVEHVAKVKEPGLLHLALGEVLLRADRVDESADALRQSLARIPGHPRALYLLGRIAERAGQKAEAKRLYRESVQHGTIDGDPYARLAQFAREEGDRRVAIEMYGVALRFDGRNVIVMNNLAELLGDEEGRLDDALRYAQNANALAPERPEFADTCGWLLLRAGRVKDAADLLEPAAVILKTNAVLQYHAGMAVSRLSRPTDARDYLERALRLDPKFPGADAARAEIDKLR